MKIFYTALLGSLLLVAPEPCWSGAIVTVDAAKTVPYTAVVLDCLPSDADEQEGVKQCRNGAFQLTVDFDHPEKCLTISNGRVTRVFPDTQGDGTELYFQLFQAGESYVLLVKKVHEFNTDVRIFEAFGDSIMEYRSFAFEGPSEHNEVIRYEVSKKGGLLLINKQSEERYELEAVREDVTGKEQLGKLPVPLDGEWQPDCEDDLGNFRVEGKKFVIDIIVKEAGVLTVRLEPVPDPENGVFLLYYRGIEFFAWPLGTEEYADYPLYEDDISQEVPVGKLIPATEKHLDLVWYGLYHVPFETVIFKDHLYYSPNAEGKIVLNHCP